MVLQPYCNGLQPCCNRGNVAQRHSDETKAAVMAALLAGQGIHEVAREFHLDASTVSRWRAKLPAAQQQAAAAATAEREQGAADEFGQLLAGYLRSTLISLRAQTEHFGDPLWLKGQNAADLAVLHGVQTDKAIRLLEAAERADCGDGGGA